MLFKLQLQIINLRKVKTNMLNNINNRFVDKAEDKQILNISDKAAERIKYLLAKRGQESLGIRISIKQGGCSGYSYSIEYADARNKFDEVVATKGVTVFIDFKAILYLVGTTMDYIEGKFASGFEFINPNEKGRCGCGKSMSL